MINGLSLLGLIKLEQSADDEDNRNNEYSDDGDCAPDDGLENSLDEVHNNSFWLIYSFSLRAMINSRIHHQAP